MAGKNESVNKGDEQFSNKGQLLSSRLKFFLTIEVISGELGGKIRGMAAN